MKRAETFFYATSVVIAVAWSPPSFLSSLGRRTTSSPSSPVQQALTRTQASGALAKGDGTDLDESTLGNGESALGDGADLDEFELSDDADLELELSDEDLELELLSIDAELEQSRLPMVSRWDNSSGRKPAGRVVRCGEKVERESRVAGWTTLKPSVGGFNVSVDGAGRDFNHYRTRALDGTKDRALSILTLDVHQALEAEGWPIQLGELGENVLVDGLPHGAFAVGRVFRLGRVTVQVTEPIVPCAYLCTLPYATEKWRCAALLSRLRGFRGWYARVTAPGPIVVGDAVQALPV